MIFPSDGFAYYEEWRQLMEKSDKQVRELLEGFGSQCKQLEVCENVYWNFSLHKTPRKSTGLGPPGIQLNQ